MKLKANNLHSVVCLLLLILTSSYAHAQFDAVNACYEQKDKACLKEFTGAILEGATPEVNEAAYLLGQLYLEEGDYEQAKDTFEIAVAFGGSEKNFNELKKLLNSGKIDLETTDCMFLKSEQCLLDVAEKKPEKAGVAYYLLAGMLSKDDPERTTELTLKAANLGHTTAACLLAASYANEKVKGPSVTAGYSPELPVDYEQSRYWSKKCGNGPFNGYSEKHFKRYQSANGHRAYAKFGTRYRTFSSGVATPELAVSLAGALCKSGTKDKEEDEQCLVVNVDGEWVDYTVAAAMPNYLQGIDSLILKGSRNYYKNKYLPATGVKVIVQGPLGNWAGWIGGSNDSLDDLTRKAIERCQNGWQFERHGSACEVVNFNGVWVQ